jgi:hypothetical protein
MKGRLVFVVVLWVDEMGLCSDFCSCPWNLFAMPSEVARVFVCVIYLSMYGVNGSSAGWIGPHTTYSYYYSFLRWIGESLSVSPLV